AGCRMVERGGGPGRSGGRGQIAGRACLYPGRWLVRREIGCIALSREQGGLDPLASLFRGKGTGVRGGEADLAGESEVEAVPPSAEGDPDPLTQAVGRGGRVRPAVEALVGADPEADRGDAHSG